MLDNPNHIADIFESGMTKQLPDTRFDEMARLTKVESDIRDAVYFSLSDAGIPVELCESRKNGVTQIDLVILDTPIEIKQYYTWECDKPYKTLVAGVEKDLEKLKRAGGGFAVMTYVGRILLLVMTTTEPTLTQGVRNIK